MHSLVLSYIFALIPLVLIDGVWLRVIARGFYARSLQGLLATDVRWLPAILFYIFYPIAISLLVTMPHLKAGTSLTMVFLYGCLLGFTAYAAYDLTNLATLKNWPLGMSIVDMFWGTFLTGVVSVLASLAIKRWG